MLVAEGKRRTETERVGRRIFFHTLLSRRGSLRVSRTHRVSRHASPLISSHLLSLVVSVL